MAYFNVDCNMMMMMANFCASRWTSTKVCFVANSHYFTLLASAKYFQIQLTKYRRNTGIDRLDWAIACIHVRIGRLMWRFKFQCLCTDIDLTRSMRRHRLLWSHVTLITWRQQVFVHSNVCWRSSLSVSSWLQLPLPWQRSLSLCCLQVNYVIVLVRCADVVDYK